MAFDSGQIDLYEYTLTTNKEIYFVTD
jgi:hypothetical protein